VCENNTESEESIVVLVYRDDEMRYHERSDSRVERGYPPLTPAACLRDNILSAVFDDLMSKVIVHPPLPSSVCLFLQATPLFPHGVTIVRWLTCFDSV